MELIKAALVLEGGSTRGVFTSGVLDFLMEKEIWVSYVIGVSAGCCNAVDYVSKQPGRTRACFIAKKKEDAYLNGPGKAIKEKSVMDMDKVFDWYPNERHPFDYDTYFSSEIVCETVATNCLTGKAEYLTENSDRTRLMQILRASCSMPVLTPVTFVDGVPYLDGGLSDSVPVQHALGLGFDKVIVVPTQLRGYRKKTASEAMQKMYKKAYPQYPKAVRTILRRSFEYNRTMNQLDQLEDSGKVFVIRPQVKPVGRLERNADTLTAFYEHGIERMEEQFGELLTYLELT